MRKALLLFLSVLLVMTAALPAMAEENPGQDAMAWLQLLFEGDYDAADAQLNEIMRAMLETQGGLPAIGASLSAYGGVTAYGEPSLTEASGYQVVTVPVTFETEKLNAQVSLDEDGLVAGLYFLPSEDDPTVQLALDTITNLASGQYEEAEAVFSPEMKQAMDIGGGIQAMMEEALGTTGALVSFGTATKSETQGFRTVTVPVMFENGTLYATVSIDGNDLVAGLMFQPEVVVEEAVVPEGMVETNVAVDAGTGYPLEGTLCIPEDAEGDLPAVLLVAGSGNNPRDEVLGANRVFAQFAHGLAERGVITLRVDKRAYIYPEIWSEPGFTVEDEYVEDVLAAEEVLRNTEGVDASRIYIAGHSQGGMLAPRFVEAGADVTGLILMAGTPRTLSDVLYDQQMNLLRSAAGDVSLESEMSLLKTMYDKWHEDAEALYKMDEEEAFAHAPLYDGSFPAYYIYDMQKHDALELLTSFEMPVLILQGSNDMQVYADIDYPLYQEALEGKPYAQFKLYEGLNHAFMPSEATSINEAILEYNQPGSIPDEVLDDIAAFVK